MSIDTNFDNKSGILIEFLEKWCIFFKIDKSTNDLYDHIYQKKLVYGGKLVGAGGSGFLLFATDKPESLRKEMKKVGIKELEFSRDTEGVKLIEL